MAINSKRSIDLFQKARKYFPGGVNSPVRAFKAVGGQPLFIKRGQGARLYDEDGNEFIDYVCSWGAGILGHAHPAVTAALKQAVDNGTSFGAPTEVETILAGLITSAIPSIEIVRFVNSGTEATMSALRVARAFTGKDKSIKFAGCYHGHSDGLLAKAGSGVATMGLPDSPGVPSSYAQNTLVVPYNDVDAVEQIFTASGSSIAAVIVEPVAANMGVVAPRPGFLQSLRDITSSFGAVLIFDEVITGFRVAYGGAQALYSVVPDLTCLGKIIGGGLPVGAYGGKKEIMEMIAPLGPVYQAGTLSGNPLAMTAGIETLRILKRPDTYKQLDMKAGVLQKGLIESAAGCGLDVYTARAGSILTMFFTNREVSDYDSARSSNTEFYSRFFNNILQSGIYIAPSQFEAAFVSVAHTEEDIDSTILAAEEALRKISHQT